MNPLLPPEQIQPQPRELRIKGSERILDMIRKFSATEKVIFGIFTLTLVISTLNMLLSVNAHYMVPVPAHGGSYSEAVVGIPRLVNPVIALSDVDRDLSTLIYSGLMKYDAQGVLIPDLAKKYTISDDSLTYTFTLRDDIRFHDGSPVTADDVFFTIDRIQDPLIQSPHRVDWKDVVAKKVSDTVIQFTLKQPYAPFLNNLTIGILPKHIWKNVDANQFIFSQYNTEPIGTGPYHLSSIERDNGGIPIAYHLTPFSRYTEGEAYISDLSLHFYSNEKAAIKALTSGDVDSLAAVSSNEAATIASSTSNISILSTPLPRIFGIFLNQNSTLFTNKEVRQALAMSVDKDRLVSEVLGGYGVPIDGPVPYGALHNATSSKTDTSSKLSASSSKAAARALLEKNGWALDIDGIYQKMPAKKTAATKSKTATAPATTTPVTPDPELPRLEFSIATADAPDLKQTAEFVKNEWKQIGVNVTVKVFESGDLTQDIIRNRKYDAVLFGEVIGKDLDLYAFWHSSQRNAPGLNLSVYVNSKADKLLEDARKTLDAPTRLQKYADFQDIVKDDAPAVFLYAPNFIYIVPEKVKGVSLNAVTAPWDRWNNVSTWYIATDNVWKFFADNLNN